MPKTVRFEGKTYRVPDDATDAEIAHILEQGNPPMPAGAMMDDALPPSNAGNPGRLLTHNRNAGVLTDAAKSLLPSLGRTVVDTAKGVYGLGRQVVEAPWQAAEMIDGTRDNVELFDTAAGLVPGIIQHAKDRYGSPEARERTVREDPIGMVADMAGLLGGGAATRAAVRPVARATGRGYEAANRGAGAAMAHLDTHPLTAAVVGGAVGGVTGGLKGAAIGAAGGGLTGALGAFRRLASEIGAKQVIKIIDDKGLSKEAAIAQVEKATGKPVPKDILDLINEHMAANMAANRRRKNDIKP